MNNVRLPGALDFATVACIFLVFLSGCAEPVETDRPVDTQRPVKLIEVSATTGERSSSYPAVIDSSRQSDLSFLVGGLLAELAVTEAMAVKEGDLVARLDSRDFEAAVDSARAVYKNAEEEYQRGVRLAAQDAIARSTLEQRESQRDVALSQLETTQKALEDSVLRAPFDGLIASVPVRESETITPGTVVAALIDVTALDATINLPASIVAQVPTHEDPAAEVYIDAAPGVGIEAFFSEANLVADATSQTYAVTFSFVAPEALLVLPGMNATVILSTGDNSDQSSTPMSLPLSAVLSDGQGQYLWIVDDTTMQVSRRDIEVAPGIGEHVTITQGLAPGDKVVGAGGAYLAEGMKVRRWEQ